MPEPKDVKLMTLEEVQAELEALAERRKLLLRVQRLLIELNPDGDD
jgi:hypothetical protein